MKQAASVYIHSYSIDFFRIIHVCEIQDRCNYSISSPVKLWQCLHRRANICIHYERLYHNKYYYIIRHLSRANANLGTKGNRITCYCARWDYEPVTRGVSTNETPPLKLWWHTSIHQRTTWPPPQIAGGFTWLHRCRYDLSFCQKNTLCIPVTHFITQPGILILNVRLNRCNTSIPIHNRAFLPVGQELPNMDSSVKS